MGSSEGLDAFRFFFQIIHVSCCSRTNEPIHRSLPGIDVNVLFSFFLFVIFAFLFIIYIFFLSLELCRCSFDISLSSRSRVYRIGYHVFYWVWLRPDRLTFLRVFDLFFWIADNYTQQQQQQSNETAADFSPCFCYNTIYDIRLGRNSTLLYY